jgi:hypothetical protein
MKVEFVLLEMLITLEIFGEIVVVELLEVLTILFVAKAFAILIFEFFESSIYPSQTVSDFQRPASFKVIFETPLSANMSRLYDVNNVPCKIQDLAKKEPLRHHKDFSKDYFFQSPLLKAYH